MICSTCKSEVYRIKTYYTPLGKVDSCKNCSSIVLTPIIHVQGARGLLSRGKRTAVHENDIKHRRLTPDRKNVYYDYGRKSFSVNGLK